MKELRRIRKDRTTPLICSNKHPRKYRGIIIGPHFASYYHKGKPICEGCFQTLLIKQMADFAPLIGTVVVGAIICELLRNMKPYGVPSINEVMRK